MFYLNMICLIINYEFDNLQFLQSISMIKLIINFFFVFEACLDIFSHSLLFYVKDLLNILQIVSIFFGFFRFIEEIPAVSLWENLRILKIMSFYPSSIKFKKK